MIDLGFYEKVIKAPNRGKVMAYKVLLAAVYLLALAVWLVSSLITAKSPALIVLVTVALSVGAYFVWRGINPEYEYAITSNSLSLAMIYAGRKRKEIFFADAEKILMIAPATDENMAHALKYAPKEQFDVYTLREEANLWLAVFEDSDEKNVLFVFEIDEEAIKLLRLLKPSAMTYR